MNLLETALCNLKDELMESEYFNRLYEYAEVIEDGDKSYPQAYIGNGNYVKVYDFDVNGSGYIRKSGDVSENKTGREIMGCSDSNPEVDLRIPLRLVCAVPKKKLGDNSFSDDTLAMDLSGYINKKQPAITDVQSVMGNIISYSTDRNRIWHQEVSGVDKQVNLNLSFVAIDFTLTVRASLDCIRINCNY